ncbi:MAG: hypothetical protein IPN42_09030 [Methylococcaceae bacterium]|nr:hypothetical protein [Methylococcaceae bacterium]
MSYLIKYQPESNAIKNIALNTPCSTPDFTGNDLWLQRTAFESCVLKYGIEFIIENINELRLELICFALLKGHFDSSDLYKLKEAISATPDLYGLHVNDESLLLIINSKLGGNIFN